MSNSVKDLINAIAEGDASTIDAAFNSAMAEKISARMEDMRVQVAQNMFTNPVAEEVSEEVSEESVEEESEEIEEEVDLDEGHKFVRKDGKLHMVDDREGPIKNTHLAKDAAYVQTNLTKHLRKHAGLSPDSDVYFDDADLVHGDKTVVRNAIHPKSNHTVGDLVTALKKHTAVHKEEVEQIDELSKKTLGSYVKKAADDKEYHGGAEAFMTRHDIEPDDDDEVEELEKTRKALANRTKGIATAVKKLTK